MVVHRGCKVNDPDGIRLCQYSVATNGPLTACAQCAMVMWQPINMKEREPDFEDDRIRAWLRKPEKQDREGVDGDPTVMAVDGRTEEIFESRTYRLRLTPQSVALVLDILRSRLGERLDAIPPKVLAQRVFHMVEDSAIKVLAKQRKEDGLISYLLVGMCGGTRWLLDRGEELRARGYHEAVCCLERLRLYEAILSPAIAVTTDDG
jgi:hypothetical protein